MRIGNFRWAVGALTLVIGAMMLVVPHQFSSPLYDALQANLALWGAAFLAMGLGLVGCAVLRPRPWIAILVHLFAGIGLLILAYGFAAANAWTGTSNWAVIGLASLLALFLPRPNGKVDSSSSVDLLSLSLGIGAAVTGLTLLALPGQFAAPIYDPYRSHLPSFGWAFLGTGVALSYTQIRPLPPIARSVSQSLLAAVFIAYVLDAAWPFRAWTDIAYYGGAALMLLVLPWIERRINLDPSSLEVRLALALSSALVLSDVLLIALLDDVILTYLDPGSVARIAEVREISFVLLVVSGVIAAAVGTAVARWLGAPLRAISRASEGLAAGDLAAPIPRSGVREVAALALAFNEMRERLAVRTTERERLLEMVQDQAEQLQAKNEKLQTQQEELQSQNEELQSRQAELRSLNERLVVTSLEMKRRAAELAAVISSIADGVMIQSATGEILLTNAAARRMVGYSPEQMKLPIEQRPSLLRAERPDGSPLPLDENPTVRAIKGEKVQSSVVVMHTPDERTVWLSVSAAPLHTPDGTLDGAVTTFTDITHLHRLQEQRDDLIRAISHDIRNPLTAVLGQAQMLQRLLKVEAPVARIEQAANAIVVGAKRMQAMTQDLADSVRLEAGGLRLRRVPVHLEAFASDMLERASGVLEIGRVRVEIPSDLPVLQADPDRLERILGNLLSNALKFSPTDREVSLTVAAADGEVLVSVADQGPGIAADEVGCIFDRFYRSNRTRSFEGLGLGLYITRAMVAAHGGRIWVESAVGKGSTFHFTLPQVLEP